MRKLLVDTTSTGPVDNLRKMMQGEKALPILPGGSSAQILPIFRSVSLSSKYSCRVSLFQIRLFVCLFWLLDDQENPPALLSKWEAQAMEGASHFHHFRVRILNIGVKILKILPFLGKSFKYCAQKSLNKILLKYFTQISRSNIS